MGPSGPGNVFCKPSSHFLSWCHPFPPNPPLLGTTDPLEKRSEIKVKKAPGTPSRGCFLRMSLSPCCLPGASSFWHGRSSSWHHNGAHTLHQRDRRKQSIYSARAYTRAVMDETTASHPPDRHPILSIPNPPHQTPPPLLRLSYCLCPKPRATFTHSCHLSRGSPSDPAQMHCIMSWLYDART
jgi:hypothetical protein